MIVRVKLFAVARQRVGRSEIEVELPASATEKLLAAAPTIAQLRLALAEQFPELADTVARSRLAVNNEYAADSHAIPGGAEVALIPPVSGG
jgi:molybdopterin converting factor small subunit